MTGRALLLVALALLAHSGIADARPQTREAGTSRAADHVILISIDGLRPDFYRDASWPAPTLQALAAEGVSADGVRGVFPSVTYPSHTTMVTGALPARHGVLYNAPFEPGGQTGRWYWEEESIRVPTLWDAVAAAGGVTASLSWPATVGAPIDFNVPEVWSLDPDVGTVAPLRDATTPPGLFEQLEREATGRLEDAEMSLDWLTRESRVAAMAAWLLENHRPRLLAVHLIGVDHFQHEDGRDSVQVRRAVATVDSAVGAILDGARRAGIIDRTAVVITGDHGFIDIHTLLAPNAWLSEAGLMEPTRDRGDWRATFHTSSASAFLYLRDPSDMEALARVRSTLESLPRGIRKLFSIIERGELTRRGASPEAALALAPIPGVSFSSSARGPAVRPGSGGTHGFLPEIPMLHTGMIGWGAGLRRDVTVHRMGLEDVAPLIAALLDLDFDAPDGVLYPGLLEDE